jgi:hypothetical protein
MGTQPIDFPTVTVAGRKLTLRFSMLAKFQMSKLGIRTKDLPKLFTRQDDPDPAIVALIMKLFSCAVADNFMDPTDPSAPANIPTPEYWAATIGDDKDLWQEVCGATLQAMVKVPPSEAAPALTAHEPGAQPLKN